MSYSSSSSGSSIEDPGPIPARLGNFLLQHTLGAGYSGSIFQATNVHQPQQVVALKVQWVEHECPTNIYERGLFPYLRGGKGFPVLFADGVDGSWDWLAMELLGSSLDGLYRKLLAAHQPAVKTMDLASVCVVGIQLLNRLEFMHQRGVLHRDIQLGNCVLGLNQNQGTVYMIDFGFSKRYIDQKGRHIPDSRAKRDFIGNYWFSSVAVHCRGRVPSRRDDLEALTLMLIHLLTPQGLPWTRNGIPKTDHAHDRLKKLKRSLLVEDLVPACSSDYDGGGVDDDGEGNVPEELGEMLAYARQLKFAEKPDYEMWRDALRGLLKTRGIKVPKDQDGEELFVWPPPVMATTSKSTRPPTSVIPPRQRHTTPAPSDEMADILNNLANIHISTSNLPQPTSQKPEIISISSTESDRRKPTTKPSKQRVLHAPAAAPPTTRPRLASSQTQKAARITQLTNQALASTDTVALATLVLEFVDLLTGLGASGKNLTREGTAFLDVVVERLLSSSSSGDKAKVNSGSGGRTRSSRSTTTTTTTDSGTSGGGVGSEKLGVVARLRRDVGKGRNAGELSGMVKEFLDVTGGGSGGRRGTLTKDGFAFLKGLADRLIELEA